jgi:hypothetical protein
MRRRTKSLAPILAALPAELRLEASPQRCVCEGCHPGMDDDERKAEQTLQDAWSDARAQWCKDHGYGVLELLRAERPRQSPGKASWGRR